MLSPADADKLIELLADTDTLLEGDMAALRAHVADLAQAHEGFDDGTALMPLVGKVPGMVSISPFRDGVDMPDFTTFDFMLADTTVAKAMRDAMTVKFGPADAGCANETRAFWALEPGRSLDWRMSAYDTVTVQLSVVASDPTDVNCEVTSAKAEDRVDYDALAAFVIRLRDEPAPLTRIQGMREWLAPYGPSEFFKHGKCNADFSIIEGTTFPGMSFVSANMELCGSTQGSKTSTLMMHAGGNDMFGKETAYAAMVDVLGEPQAACTDEWRQVWPIGQNQAIALLDLYPSFSLMLVDGPTSTFDCEGA